MKKICLCNLLIFICSLFASVFECRAEGKTDAIGEIDHYFTGTSSTTLNYLANPLSPVKYRYDYFGYSVTMPFLRAGELEANLVDSVNDIMKLDAADNGRLANSVLGDAISSALAYLDKQSAGSSTFPSMDIVGTVKNSQDQEERENLEERTTDYFLQADLNWMLDRVELFSTTGCKFTSNSNNYNIDKAAYASVGVAYQLEQDLSTGMMYDVREAHHDNGINEATAYISRSLNKKMKLFIYGVKGFAENTNDYRGGMVITYSLDTDGIARKASIKRFSDS